MAPLCTIRKSSLSRAAPSWFHNVATYGGNIESNFFSLKIHLNQNKSFRGEFGCALGTVGKHLMIGFNEGGLKISRPDIEF
jgi:hypothetical protein